MLLFILLSAVTLAGYTDKCNIINSVNFTDISFGKKGIAISANRATENVWIIEAGVHPAGHNLLAKYMNQTWVKDADQVKGAFGLFPNAMAVDASGNPAFRDEDNVLHWKREGNWTEVSDSAFRVTFGPEGSLYRVDDEYYVYAYRGGEWQKLGFQKAYSLAVDASGSLWIVSETGIKTNENSVLKWDPELGQWADMGLKGANFIAAGTPGQVYALVGPTKQKSHTIYKHIDDKWIRLPGPRVQKIAVGMNGTLYVVGHDQSILKSTNFNEKYENGHKKCVNDTLYALCKKAFNLATEGKIYAETYKQLKLSESRELGLIERVQELEKQLERSKMKHRDELIRSKTLSQKLYLGYEKDEKNVKKVSKIEKIAEECNKREKQ